MHINAKLLRVALASILSACVVPQAGDTPDSEALDHGLVVQSEDGMAPEDHAGGVPDPAFDPAPNAANTLCDFLPIVNVYAYTSQLGQAICDYGYTFVPNYANQIHRFVIGTNYRVYHTWQNVSTGVAGGWEDQGGLATSGATAGRISGGGLQICVYGSDFSTVYSKKYFPSTGWGPWTNVGHSFAQCTIEFGTNAF